MEMAGGFKRVTAKENRFLFNQGTGDKTFNTERITDLGLSMDMTKYRTYDYTTGRFMQVDPLTDQAGQEIYTPYQYSFNNPIRYNDPYGDCPKCWAIAKGIVDFTNGAVNAVASNNTTVVGADGTVLVQGFKREERGSTAYRIGQKFGDALSVGQGAIEMGLGAGVAGGSASGGVVTSPTGVGVVVGTAGAIGGVVMSAHGANTALNGWNNLLNADGKETGSYTTSHENGQKYHGKGGEERAKQSGKEKAAANDDPVIDTDWTPSKNDREGFKDEYRRMQKDANDQYPEGYKNPNNYNKRQSPGKKYLEEDGEL